MEGFGCGYIYVGNERYIDLCDHIILIFLFEFAFQHFACRAEGQGLFKDEIIRHPPFRAFIGDLGFDLIRVWCFAGHRLDYQ